MSSSIDILIDAATDEDLKGIAQKVKNSERITDEGCMLLFEKGSLAFTGSLANHIREIKHGDTTYFNRNFHIEPTNVCVFSCNFCSYSRLYAHKEDGWELSIDQMLDIVKSYDGKPITEVHIVGGVHPKMNMAYFIELMQKIKAHRPGLHVKAFTAVELDYMFRKAKLSVEEGMKQLHAAGLDSLPGGGAEIFHPEIREQICADKVDATGWLAIHEAAHNLGMHSNATMLYGHIEKYEHRVDHMRRLREVQDKTGDFNTSALAAERFDREIQIAARLQHPHIVPLLDSGEAGGLFYLVMPLIEGESLRARLVREGPLPVRDVLRIIADVADALAYAHQKGIIHRDIKPDNILLAGRHALVADFGVAKAMSEALGTDRNLTGGVALVTPAYMAPEQATADPPLDHRVDLYALGILAYELLTGRPPFDGDTPHEVLTHGPEITAPHGLGLSLSVFCQLADKI